MTTEPTITMLRRYKANREKERKYREIAERYEAEILKLLESKEAEDS